MIRNPEDPLVSIQWFKVIVIFFEFDFRKVGKAAKIKIHACHKHQIYAKLYTWKKTVRPKLKEYVPPHLIKMLRDS